MAEVIDGDLTFSGYLQPPDVPVDPIGEDWRGSQGPQGAAGATGPQGPAGTLTAVGLPTSPSGLSSGGLWNNNGVLCVV